MSTRRTFIGGLIASAVGLLAKGRWARAQELKLVKVEDLTAPLKPMQARSDGKFGHWMCDRHGGVTSPRGQYRRIMVDGGEVAAEEADDIEGWAIIDITGPGNKLQFGIRFGKAKVFGSVQILPGASEFFDCQEAFIHQVKLLNKPSSLWMPFKGTVDGFYGYPEFNRDVNGNAVVNWDAAHYHPEEFVGRDLANSSPKDSWRHFQ